MHSLSRLSYTSARVALALVTVTALVASVFAAQFAFANQDPVLCTDNGGGISVAAFRADGVTNIGVGTVTDGENINYKATLSALPPPNCAFEGGTWTLTTPDGVVHPLGAVPHIGGTGVASFASALIPYTVTHANELVNGTRHINATTAYGGGISHADANDATQGPTLGASKILTVVHTPVVATNIHNAAHGVILSAPIGATVHDNATVTGEVGGPAPTGTVTFDRYNNTTCDGSPANTQSGVALSGNIESNTTTVPNTGMSYKAHFVSGDANYSNADGICEPLTAEKLTPNPVTEIHNVTNHGVAVVAVTAGATVDDKATVTGSGPQPTGTVDFTWYTNGSCDSVGVAAGTDIALIAGVAHPSSAMGPLAAGSYSFKAHYDGDANYLAGDAQCEPLAVSQLTPTVSTDIHNAAEQVITSGAPGITVHDKAHVVGTGPVPTGTVDFTWYTNGICDSVGVAAGTDIALDGSGDAHPSIAQGPLAAGSYSFKAHYDGDITYAAANGPCEPLTISKLTPTVATDIHDVAHLIVTSVNTNTVVHDKATVTGSGPQPTGTVDFTWYTNGSCSAGATASGTDVALVAGVADPSGTQTPVAAGSYSFRAHYDGDTNYNPADGPCEPLTVNQPAGEYCSPGYWKQSQHFDSWVTYTPGQKFSAVFGRVITVMWSSKGKPAPLVDPTLLQALEANGGGISKLARVAVDGLLNSTSMNSGFTPAQVIALVQSAIDTPDYGLVDQLTTPENCPLN